jgi:Domain of unknown function (DUF4402)
MMWGPANLLRAACLCAAFIAAPAFAANQNGTVKTTALGPVSMVNTAPLDFGNIIPAAGGTVTINAQTQAVTYVGVTSAGGGTISTAKFVATGTPNATVTLTLDPSPIVLTSGANSMTVNQIRVSINGGGPQPLGPNPNLGPIGVINFAIGGRLNVGANQPAGSYTGSFMLTMDYQ